MKVEAVSVKCLNIVEDDEGVYCVPGKIYEIIDNSDETFTIDTELNTDENSPLFCLAIKKDDPDFEVIYW
jgi:hypothetical protein